jgi:hypothetical protein
LTADKPQQIEHRESSALAWTTAPGPEPKQASNCAAVRWSARSAGRAQPIERAAALAHGTFDSRTPT